MDDTDARTLRLEPTEEWLAVEYDLPREDADLAEHAEDERERYDEQIYAALVAPSF
jgi:hypothetical protein